MSSPLNFGEADGCEEGKTEGKSSGKAPALEDEAVILQFRIWLRNVNPMVWRRVQVPLDDDVARITWRPSGGSGTTIQKTT